MTSDSVRSNSGVAQRVADTLLRVMGATEICLRVTSEGASGDAGQVGLPGSQSSDIPIGMAVFRRAFSGSDSQGRETCELLVSACDLEAAAAQTSTPAVTDFLDSGTGIVVDGNVLQIVSVGSAEAFGAAYLYRVTLRQA